MRVVIATFPDEQDAETYRRSLREVFGVDGSAVGFGTIAAHGEPYHEDRLVVAWVPEHLAADVGDLAGRHGATLHEAPHRATVPRSSADEMTRASGATERARA